MMTGGLQSRLRVDRLSRQRAQPVQHSEACLGCDDEKSSVASSLGEL